VCMLELTFMQTRDFEATTNQRHTILTDAQLAVHNTSQCLSLGKPHPLDKPEPTSHQLASELAARRIRSR
jgi:hypothetical protein